GLLFASSGLGRTGLDPLIGWALVLTSQTTATAPAVLGMAGMWPRDWQVAWLAAAVLAALFVLAHVLARRGATAPHRTGVVVPADGGGR
ncbi:hypothetical protein, partial [Escherichia coli]|uniref:hypothetical protein n=1 Tax=Escherichia coli TaxID=562 RepID=UPI0032E82263